MSQPLAPDTPIPPLSTPEGVADLAASMAADALHPAHTNPPEVAPMSPPVAQAVGPAAPLPAAVRVTMEPEQDETSPLARYIGQYITLRDRIEEVVKLNKEKMEPLYTAKEKLEAFLMDQLIQSGSDSLKVRGVGTIFKATDESATVGDQDAFKRHVIGTGEFDLIDFRANKTGVRSYIERNSGMLPPGVNFTSRIKLSVRRATGKGSDE